MEQDPALGAWSVGIVIGRVGVAERAMAAGEVGSVEEVVAVEVDVPAHVRREALEVGIEDGVAGRAAAG